MIRKVETKCIRKRLKLGKEAKEVVSKTRDVPLDKIL